MTEVRFANYYIMLSSHLPWYDFRRHRLLLPTAYVFTWRTSIVGYFLKALGGRQC